MFWNRNLKKRIAELEYEKRVGELCKLLPESGYTIDGRSHFIFEGDKEFVLFYLDENTLQTRQEYLSGLISMVCGDVVPLAWKEVKTVKQTIKDAR